MNIDEARLLEEAKQILKANDRGGFTVPSPKLYPFQWNWDSCFVSIGMANYDIEAAISELQTLLRGQWENGMIPHILFHSKSEAGYFPNWDFWDSSVNSGAPKDLKTSGISNPPILGLALEQMLDKHPDHPQVVAFVKDKLPDVIRFHEFWYAQRDPQKEGLVYMYHPWESGRDNSPLWDDALNLIDLQKTQLPTYQRRDLSVADASERPTSRQYDQYVYLLLLGKRHQYEGEGIARDSEFLIQDSLMNALLIRSNQSLLALGERFGVDTGSIREKQSQSIQSYEDKFWQEERQTYCGYDLRQKKHLPYWEIGGMAALLAGVPSPEKARKMAQYLEDLMAQNYMIVPSFDVKDPLYDSKRYWRGPIWPQMNWVVYHGLKQYGMEELASHVRQNFLELVQKFGFHEYFEAQKHLMEKEHGGYGGDDFSWTASSIIDFIMAS